MTKESKTHYEPHPVSAQRKAELRAQGLTIIDAVFAPPGHQQAAETDIPAKMGIADLRDALTERGIAYPDGAKKAELQALLDAA